MRQNRTYWKTIEIVMHKYSDCKFLSLRIRERDLLFLHMLLTSKDLLFQTTFHLKLCHNIDTHIWGRIRKRFSLPLMNLQKMFAPFNFFKIFHGPPFQRPAIIVDPFYKMIFFWQTLFNYIVTQCHKTW